MSESGGSAGGGGGANRASVPRPVRRLGVDVQGRVDEYLLRVDQALARVGADMAERRVVGVRLRQQITAKLAQRAARVPDGRVTAADAGAVIAELGPPESHLNDAAPPRVMTSPGDAAAATATRAAAGDATTSHAAAPGGQAPPVAKLSKTALAGALVALAFVVVAGLSAMGGAAAGGQAPRAWALAARHALVPAAVVAPIVTTLLGLLALARIQRSRGGRYGLSLALFDALLFPLLLLDILLFWMCWQVAGRLEDQISPPVSKLITQALPTVASVLGDYFLAAQAWMAVQESAARTGRGARAGRR